MEKLSHRKKAKETGLVAGLSCLVAFTMCSLTGQLEVFSGIAHFDPRGFMVCGILALLMLAGVQSFRRRTMRMALAFINCVAACLWVVMTWWFVFDGDSLGLGDLGMLLFGSLGRAAAMGLTVQWHLHVALLGEKDVARTVSSAMIAAVSLYIALCVVGGESALAIACVMLLASGGLLVLRETCLSLDEVAEFDDCEGLAALDDEGAETKRKRTRRLWALRVRLFASRVMWGVLFGFLLSAVSVFRAPVLANDGIGIGLVAASALTVMGLRKARFAVPSDAAAFLPAILLVILGVCFYSHNTRDYARLAAGAAYVCWFALLYFQVPTYRRLMRMHPAIFAYADTLCSFVVFEGMTWLTLASAPLMAFLRDNEQLVLHLAFWYTVILFVAATFVLSRHFTNYYPERREARAASERAAGETPASHDARSIARDKGLTERETEVFLLLSEGYSRPYIQKRLFISEGTIKTHTRSIYRKLEVNSRDELIDLAHGVGIGDS